MKLIFFFFVGALLPCLILSEVRAKPKVDHACSRGVTVEHVESDGKAREAGLRENDMIVAWENAGGSSADTETGKGELAGIFDWNFMVLEQAPRGVIKLKIIREVGEVEITLPAGLWGITVRPSFIGERLDNYTKAKVLSDSGETEKGLKAWQTLAKEVTASGIWDQGCWLYLKIGKTFEKDGYFDEALAYYEDARELAVSKGDRQAQVEAWSAMGYVHKLKNDYKNAEGSLQEALKIRQSASGESLALAEALNNLGVLAGVRGDLAKGEDYYHLSLNIVEKLAPDSLVFAKSLSNLGEVTRKRGEAKEAEALHRRALEIRTRLAPGSHEMAISLNNLGILLEERGDMAKAEDYYKRALAVFEKLAPEGIDTAKTLNNMGILAKRRGDFEGALAFSERALALKEKHSPESMEVSTTLNNLGLLARIFGDYEKSEIYLRRALAIRQKLAPDGLEVASSFNNLGTLFWRRGNIDSAESYFKLALAVYERVAPGVVNNSENLSNMGDVARKKGNLAQAEDFFKRALAISEKLAPGSLLEAQNLNDLGMICRGRKQFHEALGYFQRSIEALEAQKKILGGGNEAGERFSAKYAAYYRDFIDMQLKLGKKDAAFNTLERFRARGLLDMLAERDLDFARDAPPELLREQKQTDLDYDKIQRKLAESRPDRDPEKIEALLNKLRILKEKQREIGEKIRAASPKLAALEYPKPLDVDGATRILPEGILFVSYCCAEEEMFTFALMDGNLEVYTTPLKKNELRRKVGVFRQLLSDPSSDPRELHQRSMELYSILLGPLRKQIRTAGGLLICPDGPLHAVPFSALAINKHNYLIEKKPLSYVLSATVYAELSKNNIPLSPSIRLAAFGDPVYSTQNGDLGPLPYTRLEVEGLKALYQNAGIFLGADATEHEAKSIGKDVSLIHFACHGILDERFPLNSALALTMADNVDDEQENGFFQAWEIFEGLRINADLVTLSACETGLGKEMGGEGLIGLTRAFQYAGARSVLSSLWSVSDESTALLMKNFYSNLKRGKTKAEALRLAQVDMVKSKNYSHPFYWAGFILNGDSR
jgi:CHAT domain-containing protein/Tfp pilus assembly protein PilF